MAELPRINLYHVDRLIAEGGTAKVYWGIDLRSGFPVAIKGLKIRHFRNNVIKDKFREVETQLYLHMNHPGIPRLVDFIDQKDQEQLYIVMEFIEGKNLEEYIYNEIGLIPAGRALPMFLEVLDIVEYIHNQGVLHLDIKSNNIMLQPNGQIKLIDLGIASRMSDASSSTGFGTPSYMPPEQSEMGRCGRYTDIFALGILLFEMLTGQVPFNSQEASSKRAVEEIRNKIKYDPTPIMSRYYPPIDSELQVIVERALSKLPEHRYQSCAEFKSYIIEYMRRYKLL